MYHFCSTMETWPGLVNWSFLEATRYSYRTDFARAVIGHSDPFAHTPHSMTAKHNDSQAQSSTPMTSAWRNQVRAAHECLEVHKGEVSVRRPRDSNGPLVPVCRTVVTNNP